MKQIIVTVRALIIHDQQLLMCRHNEPGRAFYNLPGGKLIPGETITDGMTRELIEETSVTPVLGHLMFINQFIGADHHRVEFFFAIQNAADYDHFDPATASHHFEVANFQFGSPTDPGYNIKPSWIAQRWTEILERPEAFRAEIITSA